MSIINHPLFLIARMVYKKIKMIIIIKKKTTEINDITLILFKFVFGRNMIAFDLRSTLEESWDSSATWVYCSTPAFSVPF